MQTAVYVSDLPDLSEVMLDFLSRDEVWNLPEVSGAAQRLVKQVQTPGVNLGTGPPGRRD